MLIREFEPEDVKKGLIEVYKEVWSINEITVETLKEWLNNHNTMIVAEDETGKIVGTCTLHIQKKIYSRWRSCWFYRRCCSKK